MKLWYKLFLLVVGVSACSGTSRDLVLSENHNSTYSIVLPANPTKLESRSAVVLQDYFKRVTGKQLPVVSEGKPTTNAIYIGATNKAGQVVMGKLPNEGYRIQVSGNDLVIAGGSGKGLIYGVYTFIDKYMGCHKVADAPAVMPASDKVTVPVDLKEDGKPEFVYRESYYSASHDAEYLEWNQLQRFEDLWGLWGHSYNKLVPAATWFKTHPEYYAQVKGVRQPSQLCLSNEAVLQIVTDELRKRMADNPDAMYWSVSPNDDIGYCECDKCRATDEAEGSHAGSLIAFVNKVATAFPDKKITTLAYAYTHKAPHTRPASNVYVFLSNIDAYRDKPIAQEPSAAAFRKDVDEWHALTPNLFLWDYVTQFTNYLAPFPNLLTLQPNMQYYKEHGIVGVFAQGSGDTYGEWAELRSYLLAKLFQDVHADVRVLTESFLEDYYSRAGAKFLLQYIGQLHGNLSESERKLDIYGNPVNEWNSYLTPANLDGYSQIFDAAEGAVEQNPVYAERIVRARLPIEYTVLQQSRFFGIRKYGIYLKNEQGEWVVNPKISAMVKRFVANCKKANVTELSEGGLTPDAYAAEWDRIFKTGVLPNKALNAKVTLQNAFAPEYPANGPATLTDGAMGYNDFSYNWLCFYGVDMVATIDMGEEKSFAGVTMSFLDDPRHWIFRPLGVRVEVSVDGKNYQPLTEVPQVQPLPEEHYNTEIADIHAPAGKGRYLRITAMNLPSLPLWRTRDGKKPMIACSEVRVQ